jgi:Protein of unknown function (DUF3800)
MKIYIDESGNSGSGIHDENQPIFACAAVWLNPAQEVVVANCLQQLHKQHGVRAPGELKGSSLLKSRNGRSFVSATLSLLDANDIPVSLVAVHKPFMAAAVLVEDCTDDLYNDEFNERWTWDTRLKEPLAEQILAAAPPAVIMAAWKARVGNDKERFKAAYGNLLDELAASANSELASAACKMQRTRFESLWESFSGSREKTWGYNPNFVAFSAMLQGLDKQAAAMKTSAIVVHDEQQQYEASFSDLWSSMNKATSGSLELPNGNRFTFPTSNITDLQFADSAVAIGIQIADVVAAASRVTLQVEPVDDDTESQPTYAAALAKALKSSRSFGEFPFLIGPKSWQKVAISQLLRR